MRKRTKKIGNTNKREHRHTVGDVGNFKYLGFYVQMYKRNESFHKDVKRKIKRGWIKWSKAFGFYVI